MKRAAYLTQMLSEYSLQPSGSAHVCEKGKRFIQLDMG
jgi:hypothetical protein